MQINLFDLDIRQKMFLKFELQMKALHDNLFAHDDFIEEILIFKKYYLDKGSCGKQ
jgi:hypothetical protein